MRVSLQKKKRRNHQTQKGASGKKIPEKKIEQVHTHCLRVRRGLSGTHVVEDEIVLA